MKSVIKSGEEQQEELVYPVLMEYINPVKGQLVVLFISEKTGACVVDTNTDNYIGVGLESVWERATNPRYWKKFTGTIELSNE